MLTLIAVMVGEMMAIAIVVSLAWLLRLAASGCRDEDKPGR